MARTIYTNHTDRIVYIGGRSVFPGSTLEVSEQDLPHTPLSASSRADPSGGGGQEAIAELLARSVTEIRVAIPHLDVELDALLAAERDGRARTGVIQAIETERLRRAAAADVAG
jgi:hypothetical protein